MVPIRDFLKLANFRERPLQHVVTWWNAKITTCATGARLTKQKCKQEMGKPEEFLKNEALATNFLEVDCTI